MSDVRYCAPEKEKVFLSGYNNFSVQRTGILTCPRPMLGMRLEVDRSLTPLFPYLNGFIDSAKYFDSPDRVQFVHEEALCTLYDREIIAAAFNDYDAALAFGERLLVFLNGLHASRRRIKPDYRKFKPPAVLDVYKLLPKTNCKKCGFTNCLAFAAALSRGKTDASQCPGFAKPIAEKAVYPLFDRNGNLASTVEIDLEHSHSGPSPNPEARQMGQARELLTRKEFQVLRLLAKGATNSEIAAQLSISPHTVKTHVGHIFDKLGVNDRTRAAVWASRHDIV